MPTTPAATRTIPQELLDGIRNSDDAAIERGFRAIFPSLIAEATQQTENPSSAALIVGKAFLKVMSAGKSIASLEQLDAAIHTAIHEAVVRDQSRRAGVHRFEHNEGVSASHASAPLTPATVDVDQVWSRVKQANEALKHPSKPASSADMGHRAASHMADAMDRKNKWAIPVAI